MLFRSAQAAIAKAKEAVASRVEGVGCDAGVASGAGSGQPLSCFSKRGTNKRAKSSWPPAGRASASRIFRINEGVILEY